jgi:hypothetical protein
MSIWKEPQDSKCYFANNGECSCLDKICDGFKAGCKFRKSERDFHKERDASIDRCRTLGLCDPCKYGQKCKKSDETED